MLGHSGTVPTDRANARPMRLRSKRFGMTAQKNSGIFVARAHDMRSRSRDLIRPGSAKCRPSLERGRRECRASGAPAASRAQKKAHECSHRRFADNVPAFPARLVLTVSFVVSSESRAFLPPSSALKQSLIADLIPASGYRDATTSPSAMMRVRLSRHRVLRIPAQRS